MGSAEFDGAYRNLETTLLNDMPNADRLLIFNYFMYGACQVISESKDLSDSEKIQKFEILIDKWERRGGNYIITDLNSSDPTRRLAAIELVLRHEDPFVRQMSIERGLSSDSMAVQSLALQSVFINKTSIGGYICTPDDQPDQGICSHTFNVILEQVQRSGNGLALSGHMQGGLFDQDVTEDDMQGTLIGRVFSLGGKSCSITANLGSNLVLVGRMECDKYDWDYPPGGGSATVVINVY